MQLLDDSSYWTKQRRELVRWLDDRAPSFSCAYVGAVRLLHTPSFPAREHFICHAVRDIYRLLPAALGAKAPTRPAEVLPDMARNVAKIWERYPPNQLGTSERAGSDVRISLQAYNAIQMLVEKSKNLEGQPSTGKQLAIALFRSFDRWHDGFIYPWIINAFADEYRYFVSRAHLAISSDRVPTDDGLIEHFEAFERAFHSLVGPYFTCKEELDAILQDTNTTAD